MRALRVRHFAFFVLASALAPRIRPAPRRPPARRSACRPTSIRNRDSACRCRRREDLDEAGKQTFDRASTPGGNIAGLQGPAAVQLYSTKTTPHLQAHQPLSALRCRLLAAHPRDRDPRRPRARWTASSNGSRTSPRRSRKACRRPSSTSSSIARSTAGLDETDATVIELGRQLWHDHKVTLGDFREGQGAVRAEQARRSRAADGQLRRHGRAAHRRRHAAAQGKAAAAADSVSRHILRFRLPRNAQEMPIGCRFRRCNASPRLRV